MKILIVVASVVLGLARGSKVINSTFLTFIDHVFSKHNELPQHWGLVGWPCLDKSPCREVARSLLDSQESKKYYNRFSAEYQLAVYQRHGKGNHHLGTISEPLIVTSS